MNNSRYFNISRYIFTVLIVGLIWYKNLLHMPYDSGTRSVCPYYIGNYKKHRINTI